MATEPYPPLTSKNVKKLQKHLEEEDSKGRSLKRVPVRTEADGKSSVGRLSQVSELNELKKNLNVTSSKQQKHQSGNSDGHQIVRPEREAVRNNPEGQSNGPSRAAPTPVKKPQYEEDTEERINYEDMSTDGKDSGTVDQEDQLSNKEESENEASEATSSVSSTPEPANAINSSRATYRSNSSYVTSQGGQTSDEEDEQSDDSTMSPSASSVSPTQSVYMTGYATSVADSMSTIPTNPPSRAETVASKSSIKTEKRPESSKSYVSDTPSYILNKNQYKMKQALVKTSKAHKSEEETESESSFNISRENSFSDVRTRDRATSSAQSRGSYVTVRHFARWSSQSDGGYSIRDEPIPPKFKRRKVNTVSSRSHEKSRDIAVRSASNHLRTTRVQSEPNMRLKGRRRVTTFIDTNIAHEGRSNAASRLSGRRTGVISRLSTRSIMKQPATLRAKSEPSLRALLRRLSFLENHPLNTGKIQKSSGRSSRERKKKSKDNLNNGDDSGNEFINRTKRVRKRRERPKRDRVDSGMSGVSNVREEELRVSGDKPLRRRRGRTRALPQNTNTRPEELTVSENKPRRKRRGKTTSNNAKGARESPQITRQLSGTKDTKARTKKSLSSSGESSDESGDDALSSQAREERNRMTSASTVVSRKSPLITFINDSGFFSARQYQSSPTSHRAPMTPDSFRDYRSPSLRSDLTIYSSDPSRPVTRRSSRNGNRPGTSLSFLSRTTPNGESTAIGPDGELLFETPDDSSDQSPEREKEKEQIPERQRKQLIRPDPEQRESGGSDTDKQLRLPPIKSASSSRSPYNTHVNKTPTMKELVEKFEKMKKKTIKNSRRKAPKLRINHPMPSFAEATRERGLIRMITLSRPKRSKAVYATSFEPNWVWGNQETIWPLSRAALNAAATPRVEELATSKKNFRLDHPEKCSRGEFTFSCGRNSMIWKVSPLAMKAEPSARISELAKPKQTVKEFDETCERPSYIFGCGRSSPIWPVDQDAKTAEEREHSLRLAEPKKTHPAYQPGKPVVWPVSEAAKKASPTPRVEQLARPKTRGDGPFREPTWRVSSASRRVVATPRVLELARPKLLAEGYQPCREVEWIIPRNTLRAIASERTQVLSKPIIRESMDHVQFNPEAFTVSEAAKNAKISGRIAELAQPLARSGFR